jgi:quercetin dioxygenase-like cupin family protein
MDTTTNEHRPTLDPRLRTAAAPADGPVDIDALADELLEQAGGSRSGRAARTLPHPVDGLRQTVIALRDGAALQEHNSPGPAALLVLRGRARLAAGENSVTLNTHQHLPIPPQRHSLHAEGDTVVLLSVAVAVPATSGRRPAPTPAEATV